jgi:hypothetical protein
MVDLVNNRNCLYQTAGAVSAETIQRFIERSEHVTKRR